MSKALDQTILALRELLQSRLLSLGYTGTFPRHLEEAITDWNRKTQSYLQANSPFTSAEEHLTGLDNAVETGTISSTKLEEFVSSYADFTKAFGIPNDKKFWSGEIKKLGKQQSKAKLLRLGTLLRREWRRHLYREQVKWEFETINELRTEFIKNLEQWFRLIKTVADNLDSMGLKPYLFWDLSQGTPSTSDIQQLEKWVDYLSKNDEIKELCNLLGRMRSSAKSVEKETLFTTEYFEETVLDIDSSEELAGVTLGNDIAAALPQEIALISSPETEILFDLKYAESRLMCFEKIGFQSVQYEQEVSVEVEKKEEKGPMVICVDTSGSMVGAPETIAKAVTLFMAMQVIQENRACYLINFSTGIECLEISAEMGLAGVMQFLRKSFHGGTDAAPAINEAMRMIDTEHYKNADVIVISDFLMNELGSETLSRVENVKSLGTRFVSLCIGSLFISEHLKTYFDSEWVYDSSSASIYELVKHIKESTSRTN